MPVANLQIATANLDLRCPLANLPSEAVTLAIPYNTSSTITSLERALKQTKCQKKVVTT